MKVLVTVAFDGDRDAFAADAVERVAEVVGAGAARQATVDVRLPDSELEALGSELMKQQEERAVIALWDTDADAALSMPLPGGSRLVGAYHVEEIVKKDYDRTWPSATQSPGFKMIAFLHRRADLTPGGVQPALARAPRAAGGGAAARLLALRAEPPRRAAHRRLTRLGRLRRDPLPHGRRRPHQVLRLRGGATAHLGGRGAVPRLRPFAHAHDPRVGDSERLAPGRPGWAEPVGVVPSCETPGLTRRAPWGRPGQTWVGMWLSPTREVGDGNGERAFQAHDD